MLNEEINIVHDIKLLKEKNQKILLNFSQILNHLSQLRQFVNLCDFSLKNCQMGHLLIQIVQMIQSICFTFGNP